MNLRKLEKAVTAIITKHAPDPDGWIVGMDDHDQDGEPEEPTFLDAWREDPTKIMWNGRHRHNLLLTFFIGDEDDPPGCAHVEFAYRVEGEPKLLEPPLVKRSVSWKEGIALLKKNVSLP